MTEFDPAIMRAKEDQEFIDKLLRARNPVPPRREQQPPTVTTSLDDLRNRDFEQDIELKKKYANLTLLGIGVQVLIADVAFFYYLIKSGRQMSPVVMDIWLGATVVQVIGIILVITRYLFPPRDETRRS